MLVFVRSVTDIVIQIQLKPKNNTNNCYDKNCLDQIHNIMEIQTAKNNNAHIS